MTKDEELILSASKLNMQFGGQVAVNNVDCEFRSGQLTALIGPNGAGKSTLFNLLSGQLKPSSGSILFNGINITKKTASQRTRMGIGRAFQRTHLFPGLSVFENICISVQARLNLCHQFWSLSSSITEISELTEDYLCRVHLIDERDLLAKNLSHGGQRRLEVGMLMALNPKVYMFDEPTTGMSMKEVPGILDLISSIRQKKESIVILIEHKMDIVKTLAERVIVLHNGRLLADGGFDNVMNSPQVQSAYLGISTDTGAKFVS